MALALLRRALGAALRRPLLALPLYAANLLLALVPTVVAALGFEELIGARPWASTLLGGDWLNQMAEVFASGDPARWSPNPAVQRAQAQSSGGFLLAVLGLALLLQGLAYNALAGGMLERLRGHGLPFWVGCRHWFWAFCRLALLGTLLFLMLGFGGALVLGYLQPLIDLTVTLVVAVGWLILLNSWLELARAGMVARHDHGALRALARAGRLALTPRRLPAALLIWLALALAGLGLLALQTRVVDAVDAAEGAEVVIVLLAALLSQALQFAGAWLKVARLASALALDGTLEPAHHAASHPQPALESLPPNTEANPPPPPSLRGKGR